MSGTKKIEIEVEKGVDEEDIYKALENKCNKEASFKTKKMFAFFSFLLLIVFGAADFYTGASTPEGVKIILYCFTALILGFMGFDSFENVKNGSKH